MTFQTPITIRKAIEGIRSGDYVIPSIQRELVWSHSQIQALFDSLMSDYPIGSFLFWDIPETLTTEYQFYGFIKDYHARDCVHNPKVDLLGRKDVTGVLDGQQRLTALYIGLRGTYAYKLPRKRWENDDAFPIRKLYVNLLSESKEFDSLYDFRFLTKEQAKEESEDKFWFEVGKIMEFDPKNPKETFDYLVDNNLVDKEKDRSKFAAKCIFKLAAVVSVDGNISYYEETTDDLNKVLNIFIRVNSGGTPLSYSDLLLSIATAQWKEKDARDEIHKFVDTLSNLGEGFNFDKDFVLKACLVLSNFGDIRFKVDNFNRRNMREVEKNWDGIMKSLRIAVDTISSFGYGRRTLTSNYAVIPIAHYIQSEGNPENFPISLKYREDRRMIRMWLTRSLLKRAFGGQPDNVLRPIRTVINENPERFPYKEIVERFRGKSKTIVFTNDDVENLLFYEYGKGYTFSVLALLQPTLDFRNRFHIDHIHPKSLFRSQKELRRQGIPDGEHEFYMENCNRIGNLHLLEGISNEEKRNKHFKDWLDEVGDDERTRRDLMKKHFIPDVDLGFQNFKEFMRERNALIRASLRRLLLDGADEDRAVS